METTTDSSRRLLARTNCVGSRLDYTTFDDRQARGVGSVAGAGKAAGKGPVLGLEQQEVEAGAVRKAAGLPLMHVRQAVSSVCMLEGASDVRSVPAKDTSLSRVSSSMPVIRGGIMTDRCMDMLYMVCQSIKTVEASWPQGMQNMEVSKSKQR